jgi:hypothetical protein
MGGGQAAVNTLWYQVGAVSAPAATDQDAADNMDSLVSLAFRNLLNVNASYKGVQAQIYTNVQPYMAKYVAADAVAGAGAGAVTGDPMPPQTSGLLNFQSVFAGQRNRGRFYMPFPGQTDDSGGGSPSAGYIARLLILGGIVGVGLGVAAGGRTATLVRVLAHGKDKLGLYHLPTPVTAYYVGTGWATQRRRGDYGRLNRSPI